ncbi:MAG: Mur ligase family protein [Gemmatimonadaceae bacterium]
MIGPDCPDRIDAWAAMARRLLDALAWSGEEIVVRRWPGGAGLFVSAPLDGLFAATEVTEQAWGIVETGDGGRQTGDRATEVAWDDLIARLRVHVQHERNDALVGLAREAAARTLVLSFDDELVAVGSGNGVRIWPIRGIPATEAVTWSAIHDVPIALVTGSNGKTTTARLLAAMLRGTGQMVGYTCTDGVYVGSALVASGDYSGPAGARRVLHDARVDAAVLETARGGILRRGLAMTRADVAVVTRVAADHLGEYGISTESALGHAKLVVARVLRPNGHLVLNADDPTLVALAPSQAAARIWFSLDSENSVVRAHLQSGGTGLVLSGGALTLLRERVETVLLPAAEIPMTLDGAARYNIANALAAAAAAYALEVPLDVIRASLRSFGASATDNPGRLHVREHHHATVILDFVHNADGWRALYEAVRHWRGARTIVTLGQAGDRDDDSLRELARAVWAGRPDVIILKEMPAYLRGRPLGETTTLLATALTEAGAPDTAIRCAPDELQASRAALHEAGPGDLVILGVHSDYERVMAMVGT